MACPGMGIRRIASKADQRNIGTVSNKDWPSGRVNAGGTRGRLSRDELKSCLAMEEDQDQGEDPEVAVVGSHDEGRETGDLAESVEAPQGGDG